MKFKSNSLAILSFIWLSIIKFCYKFEPSLVSIFNFYLSFTFDTRKKHVTLRKKILNVLFILCIYTCSSCRWYDIQIKRFYHHVNITFGHYGSNSRPIMCVLAVLTFHRRKNKKTRRKKFRDATGYPHRIISIGRSRNFRYEIIKKSRSR